MIFVDAIIIFVYAFFYASEVQLVPPQAHGYIQVLRSTFSGNRAAKGGAIACGAKGRLTMTDAILDGNRASRHGGALALGHLTNISMRQC